MMTWYLFLISLGMDFTSAHIARKAVKAKPTQGAVDGGVTHSNIVITLQVPDDANRPEVIFTSQMNNFCNNFCWHFTGMVLGCRRLLSKSRLTLFIVPVFPPIEGGPGNAEVAAGHTHITDSFGMLKYA